MKILTIVGARPQFIKAGAVSRETARFNGIEEILIHTGQHYDSNMSNIFFEQMKIPKPDYYLGIGGKTHGAMTGQMMERIEEIAIKEKPDIIMVYGDTNSTLAGALVGSKIHIPVAHIEAGLRSFNFKMPEEINRILTDRISRWLFCPTDTAVKNLGNEGFKNFDCKIIKNGDVMQDAVLFYKQFAKKPQNLSIKHDFILSTIHRAENTDDRNRLKNIFEALEIIAEEKQIILPLHPRTKKIVDNIELNLKNITIIQPVGYLEMVWLLENSTLVITDSGGLQKEAFFFRKPCITLRDETEWIELVENRFNMLAGADIEKILDIYKNYEFNKDFDIDLYGNGKASNRIIMNLLDDMR